MTLHRFVARLALASIASASLLSISVTRALAAPSHPLVTEYLARWFEMYPGRATQAGVRRLDGALEAPTTLRRERWTRYNDVVIRRVHAALAASPPPSPDDRLDLSLVLRQAERERFEYSERRRPATDPMYWTSMVSEATVFLLAREDRPLVERMAAVERRLAAMPTLLREARRALTPTAPDDIVPDFARLGARQLRASAQFYREGLPLAARALSVQRSQRLARSATRAATSLDSLAGFLDTLATRATASPRLGARYARVFRVETGIEEPVDSVLARAERDLIVTRAEVATYARAHWGAIAPAVPLPASDQDVVARAFDAVAAARDTSVTEYLAFWRTLPAKLEAFIRERDIATLPEPRTLVIDVAPSFFVGQSVGGVYPAGPFDPAARTILYVPVPPVGATRAASDVFFRDFNRPFTAMIATHELMPGHYAQLKAAARGPRPVRAVFGDGVFTEGWGTFVERVMLDAGWGGPLEFLAHYKKRMENIARVVVDIRVHTKDMAREAMQRFVREEALQGEQLAANMWTRTLTTAPQITTYWLGEQQIRALLHERRAREGGDFSLRRFMDDMVSLGSAPVPAIAERLRAAPR